MGMGDSSHRKASTSARESISKPVRYGPPSPVVIADPGREGWFLEGEIAHRKPCDEQSENRHRRWIIGGGRHFDVGSRNKGPSEPSE
jgi:hypothetical protein